MANESLGLLGRKIGMTQLFNEEGDVVPVTVLEVGPNRVLQVKRQGGNDGYAALQLGFGAQKSQRLAKPLLGHFKKAGVSDDVLPPRHVAEIRVSDEVAGAYEAGQLLGAADVFEVGAAVDVTGQSKGRGFSGVMRRHNFRGFIRTHGTHEYFRHGGSIGTRLTPGMTLKGKKMPGQMGSKQTTVQNIQVVRVDAERNLVFLKGGVPGPKGGILKVRKAVKKG
jgi:large subunit ribosomal protein L3